MTEEVHLKSLKRSIAIPNDVLMNIVGPPLGKVALLTEQFPEWNLNQAIILFRSDPAMKGTAFLLKTVPNKAMFGLKAAWRGAVKVKVKVSDPNGTKEAGENKLSRLSDL